MEIAKMIKDAVLEASTTFRKDQLHAYRRALDLEVNENARWVLELLLENAEIAHQEKMPLCDDTGIPHIYIEVGEGTSLPAGFFKEIKGGVAWGLRELPARPMAVRGDSTERIEQSQGLYNDPGMLVPPSLFIDTIPEDPSQYGGSGNGLKDGVKVHVLMLGGGPEIRAHTYKVFHKRDHRKVFGDVKTWLRSEIPMLGCTPCIPAIGIGRTHFEASSLMLKAMAYGDLNQQSKLENDITKSLNSSNTGALGIGGSVTALGSFIKVGPQRASGVRIVCTRPCCCVEPRRSSVYISSEALDGF